ncbi:heavy-metal-associated domain-containing protein [Candidatus Peregrinibacteria bacterium]|nr:heavy-metal-associated domain-containing protein [Candidatus Peregrinibacteria bacterium]
MKTVASIPGMHCPSCVAMIREISGEFPAIQTVDVDLATKKVTLTHTDAFDIQKWKREIEALGESYKVASSVSP